MSQCIYGLGNSVNDIVMTLDRDGSLLVRYVNVESLQCTPAAETVLFRL